MNGGVRGIFPGGPTRGGARAGARPRLPTVADRWRAGIAEGTRRARRRRRSRALAGAALVLASAGFLGVAAGRRVGTPAPDRAARADSASAVDRVVSREVNRVLLELWKMEGLEVAP